MEKKLQKSLDTNSVNQELLNTILDLGAEESKANNKLIKELIKGEKSPLLSNFNPKNQLTPLHQSNQNSSVLLISQLAIHDLEFIGTLTNKNASIKNMDILNTALITGLSRIAQDFTIGKSIENIRDGYRFLSVGNCHIYYRADLPDTVEVIRVLFVG